MRNYVPYMAVLLALHATTVVLLFELVRRRAGDLIAVGAAALLLVMGAAWENLLWAFQIGFVGSVACGLGSLLLLNQSGPPLPRVARDASQAGPPHGVGGKLAAIIVLFWSLMFSGLGLFFLIAASAWLPLTPYPRQDVALLAPAALPLG